jgi:hypothetical protein
VPLPHANHRSKNTPQGVWFCGVEEGEEKTNPAGHTYTVKPPNIYLEMVNFSLRSPGTEMDIYVGSTSVFSRTSHQMEALTTMVSGVVIQLFANPHQSLSCGSHPIVKEFEFRMSHYADSVSQFSHSSQIDVERLLVGNQQVFLFTTRRNADRHGPQFCTVKSLKARSKIDIV